jgi:hypothetical protein
MKKILLPTLAFAVASISANSFAQSNRAFAITSESKGSFNWNAVREIDLTTGEVVKTHYDQLLNKNFELTNTANARISAGAGVENTRLLPMAEGVAAAAYDAKQNRLYYTTMRGTELRYFDLNNANGKVVYNQKDLLLSTSNRYDEGNVITRMTFASDGNGYALTNDGNHLIRFSSNENAAVTDLGTLTNGANNGEMSVHSQCTSWGGDMVGDAFGNLYLVTARNNIFKINPKTSVADYVGVIKGLPTEFTSNGMAVTNDGEVILSSASVSDRYFRLNISTLEATGFNKTGSNVYNTSDLANSNLLYQSNATKNEIIDAVRGKNVVSVYPNPVSGKTFNVRLDKLVAGKYNLVLTDVLGRTVVTRNLNVTTYGQVERIALPRAAASGMYMLKLTGDDNRTVYNDKIVVE